MMRGERPEVVAIFGPTGIGKTAVAVALAERMRARGEEPVAISADALQVYRGLETLTAAATAEEQALLEHRLVGFVPVTDTFSVGAYMELAHREIDTALEAGRCPIVVGGTGLYLRAALTDLSLAPAPPPQLRERLEREIGRRGSSALHAELRGRAPVVAAAIPPGDRTRVVRALELLEMGEEPDQYGTRESELWTAHTRRPTLLIGLLMDRAELYRAIDERSERIFAEAREEVRRADEAYASRTARKAVGFDELLRGDLDGLKRRTRNFARRQLTWMRKLAGKRTIDVTGRSPAEVAAEIDAACRTSHGIPWGGMPARPPA